MNKCLRHLGRSVEAWEAVSKEACATDEKSHLRERVASQKIGTTYDEAQVRKGRGFSYFKDLRSMFQGKKPKQKPQRWNPVGDVNRKKFVTKDLDRPYVSDFNLWSEISTKYYFQVTRSVTRDIWINKRDCKFRNIFQKCSYSKITLQIPREMFFLF